MRPGQSGVSRQQHREIRGVKDRGSSVLDPAETSTVSTGDQGGEHEPGEVRGRGDSVAGHMVRCLSQPVGGPSAEFRGDAPGGCEATPDSQTVRRTSSIGEELAGRDCAGEDALRFRADLERPGEGRRTVPAGHQQNGKVNAGGPSVNAAGHHHGRTAERQE